MEETIFSVTKEMLFLLLIIGLGFILKKWAVFNSLYKLINAKNLETAKITFWRRLAKLTYNVSFPALMLAKLGQKEWQADYFPFLGGSLKLGTIYLATIVTLAYVIPQPKRFKQLSAAIAHQGNTAFLGFPLIIGVMGEEFLPYAAMLSALMLVLGNATGIIVFGLSQGKSIPNMIKQTATKLCLDPVILGCLAGAFVAYFNVGQNAWWQPVQTTTNIIGWTATPLALLCIGSNLKFQKTNASCVVISSFLKLIIAPLIIFTAMRFFSDLKQEFNLLIILLLSTPVAASMTIFVEKYSGDRDLITATSNTITLSTLLSIITLSLTVLLV